MGVNPTTGVSDCTTWNGRRWPARSGMDGHAGVHRAEGHTERSEAYAAVAEAIFAHRRHGRCVASDGCRFQPPVLPDWLHAEAAALTVLQ